MIVFKTADRSSLQIACVQYVGVLMLIFVKSELRPDIRMLQETSRGIGLLGFGVSYAFPRTITDGPG